MISKAIIETAPLSLLFPLLLSIIFFKRQLKHIQVICVFVIGASCTEILLTSYWLHKENNLFLLHIYTVFELEIVSLFYFMILKGNYIRVVILLLMLSFLIFSFIDAYYLDGLRYFNTYARSIEGIIIMSYAIYFLYNQLGQQKAVLSRKDPLLLINIAFLLYFSISFFLFLYSNYIMKETFKTHVVWMMHALALWIYYTTIGIALWKAGRK